MQRAHDINAGTLMVGTDLHGDWQTWEHLRDTFLRLQAVGKADHLLICGDFIHGTETATDHSWEMLQDFLALREQIGQEHVLMLCGNHELPHILDMPFSKGEALVYNGALEWAIARGDALETTRFRRAYLRQWLMQLPFYARTTAGVTFSHAGAPSYPLNTDILELILTFDFASLLKLGDDLLRQYDLVKLRRNAEYVAQARAHLAVTDVRDPRFTHLLRAHTLSDQEPLYAIVWATLFTDSEHSRGIDKYLQDTRDFLRHLTTLSDCPQRILVAGHVVVPNGAMTLGAQFMRFASGVHAVPRDRGVYLLMDAAEPVKDAAQLARQLVRIWR